MLLKVRYEKGIIRRTCSLSYKQVKEIEQTFGYPIKEFDWKGREIKKD